MNRKAALVLEDGKIFYGFSFGADGEKTGEVVFNTSMTGYQEILTDPSYKGQIVIMTYPQVGNYGVNPDDMETEKPHVEGFVVGEYSKTYSNWRANGSLGDFLKKHNVVAIEGIDTRSLVRHIREKGAMKGIVSTEAVPSGATEDLDEKKLIEKARNSPGLILSLIHISEPTRPY